MAAVAHAQYEACGVNLEYGPMRYNAEGTGDQKLKAGLALEKSVKVESRAENQVTQVNAQMGSGQKSHNQGGGGRRAGDAYLSNGITQGEDAAVEAETSNADKISAEGRDELEKSSSDVDSVNAEAWGGSTEPADDAQVDEVANRNNCMLVFLLDILHF